jgi:RNA recognition motif-containing protein
LKGKQMTKKLYAGNLWFEATEAELKEWFGQSGPVEMVRIIPDRVGDKDIAELMQSAGNTLANSEERLNELWLWYKG